MKSHKYKYMCMFMKSHKYQIHVAMYTYTMPKSNKHSIVTFLSLPHTRSRNEKRELMAANMVREGEDYETQPANQNLAHTRMEWLVQTNNKKA